MNWRRVNRVSAMGKGMTHGACESAEEVRIGTDLDGSGPGAKLMAATPGPAATGMSVARLRDRSVLLDLGELNEGDRASMWRRWVSANFPGMQVASMMEPEAPVLVRRITLGAAMVWDAVGTRQILRYAPQRQMNGAGTVALIIQREGCSSVRQDGRVARLSAGDLCVTDNALPFEIEALSVSRPMIVVLPRHFGQSRFPTLMAKPATEYRADLTVARMVCTLLSETFENAALLEPLERASILEAIVALVAALPDRGEIAECTALWRVRRACRDIAELASTSGLTAADIADRQRISRRALDKLFVKHVGRTVCGQIMERRLDQAARALGDFGQRDRPISDICFASGFQDAGHFSRAFRKRFDCSATEWRARRINAST